MRLIDADVLKDDEVMRKVFPNLTDELYGMLQLIDEQPTVTWFTLDDDTKLKDGLYLVTTIDHKVGIAEYSNEPKCYESGNEKFSIGECRYWNIPDEIIAVIPYEPYKEEE